MTRLVLAAVAAIVFLTAGPSPAQTWLRAESDNFIAYSDAGASADHARALIAEVMGEAPPPPEEAPAEEVDQAG